MYGNNGWTISKWLIETTAKTYPRQYRDLQSDIDKYGMTKKQVFNDQDWRTRL